MTTVRLGGDEGPRWMTTVTLPLDSASADNTVGAWFRPFCVPLMYSSPHFPGGTSAKYPRLVRLAKRALTVAESGQAAQLSEFEQAFQWPGGPSFTNNSRAACRAPATPAELGAGLDALDVVGDPQPTKARRATAGRRARKSFASGRIAVELDGVWSMLVEHPCRRLVTTRRV